MIYCGKLGYKMKKLVNIILLSLSISIYSCNSNIPLETNIKNTNIISKNTYIKGNINLNFNFSDLKLQKGFTVKNLDYNNPEIKKVKFEIVGKDFGAVSQEKDYIPNQSINFTLQAPVGKNRVLLLYTLDKMGNVLSQFMGVMDIKSGENTGNISYIDTVIAQVFYTIILDKNSIFRMSNSGIGEGRVYDPNDPFLNFNLIEANKSLIEKLNIEDVRKFVYDYTGYNKETNSYTKIDPLSFNSVGFAKELVKNHFLKKYIFPSLDAPNLSGFAYFEAGFYGFDLFIYEEEVKFNFSDLKSPSGTYLVNDLFKLKGFSMPGVWNYTMSKPGYKTKRELIPIDPYNSGYHFTNYKKSKERSYHSTFELENEEFKFIYDVGKAKLLLREDEEFAELSIDRIYQVENKNVEITLIDKNGSVFFKIQPQNDYNLLKKYPLQIDSNFLKQLKERNVFIKVLDKSTNKEYKSPLIMDKFMDIEVRLYDNRINNRELVDNAKITVKSLESGENFTSTVNSNLYLTRIKNVPVGNVELTAEKDGYATKTKTATINEGNTLIEMDTYLLDNSSPKVSTIKFGYSNESKVLDPGDIGVKRPIEISGQDNNINYVPNINSNVGYSVNTQDNINYFNRSDNTSGSKQMLIIMSFNKPIKRDSFENNFQISSEISNTYNGKEIVRRTSSEDAGFTPAFVIDKNTTGAKFEWLNDDREVRFTLSNKLFWLNQGKELRYKLTFKAPFEDSSGLKAISATSSSANLADKVTSTSNGYIKYSDSVFADYVTFSAKKDPNDYSSSYGIGYSNLPELSFSLNKDLNVLGKSLIPKNDLNGNIINQTFIYDKDSKEIRFIGLDGKIKSFAKLYIKKLDKQIEEPLNFDKISYTENSNGIKMTFSDRFFQKGDTLYQKLLIPGIDGSPIQDDLKETLIRF